MLKTLAWTILISAAALAQQAPPKQFVWKLVANRPGFSLQTMTPEEREAVRGHSQYLMSLHAEGKLTHAVQVFDPKGTGGFIIVNAASLEEAATMMENDPSVKSKLFHGEALPARVAVDRCTSPMPAPAPAPAREPSGPHH
jgi:uncharacterized protein YciI